jgi:hypothetical protein
MYEQTLTMICEKLRAANQKEIDKLAVTLAKEVECDIFNHLSMSKWYTLCAGVGIVHQELQEALTYADEDEQHKLIALYMAQCVAYSETFSFDSLLNDTRQYLESFYDVDELIHERIATVPQAAISKLTNEEKHALVCNTYHEFPSLDIDDLALNDSELYDFATSIADNRAFDLEIVFDDSTTRITYIMLDSVERLSDTERRTDALLNALAYLEDDIKFGSLDEWRSYKNSKQLSQKLIVNLPTNKASTRPKL